MPSRPARLLCVGNEQDPLMTRCAVLGGVGYPRLKVKSGNIARIDFKRLLTPRVSQSAPRSAGFPSRPRLLRAVPAP